MDVFIIMQREGTQFVWDLKRRIKRWRVDEVKPLLESGKTIAVISTGDPYEQLARSIDEGVVVQIIGRFDYNENRPQKEKIFLSRVRLQE